jgi:formate-dependent nitrite reductase membrane component NrfD
VFYVGVVLVWSWILQHCAALKGQTMAQVKKKYQFGLVTFVLFFVCTKWFGDAGLGLVMQGLIW